MTIDPLNTLAVVAGALVAVDPSLVFDPGFQLTFGATTGILLGVQRLVTAVLPQAPKGIATKVRLMAGALLAATVCAEAALFPIGATLFSRISVAGLVLNFVAIPLMAVTQLAGMAAVALFLGHVPSALVAGWIAHVAAAGIVDSTALIVWAPWLVWRLRAPHLGLTAAYYGGWIVWFAAVGSPRIRQSALVAVTMSGAAILTAPLPGLASIRTGEVCAAETTDRHAP